MNVVDCPYCGYNFNDAISSTNQTFSEICNGCGKKFAYKLIITKRDDE